MIASGKDVEPALADANGQLLQQFDDVMLLHAIPVTSRGTADVEIIGAGTRATIILIDEGKKVADLECYVLPPNLRSEPASQRT
jgi:uncharacterized Zn ribbon protein